MEPQETQFRQLYEQFLTWQTSQQHQTDGYAYEESFAGLAQQLNQQLLAIALDKAPAKQTAKKK